jgi:glutaredoxin
MDHAGTSCLVKGPAFVRPCREGGCFSPTYSALIEPKFRDSVEIFRARIRAVASRAVVRMYSRRTCGLCDEARSVIEKLRDRGSFDFDEVFIDGDEALELDYGLRVPVVEVDGAEEFEFTVDPAAFERLVDRPDSP